MKELALIEFAGTDLGLGGKMIIMVSIGVIFIYIVWMDWKTLRIPDRALLWLLGAVLLDCMDPQTGVGNRVAGALCVSVPMLVLALLCPKSLGGGDIKLMAVCGLWLGWKDCLTAAYLAILSGGVWAVCLLAAGRRGLKSRMAFGPFLIAGTMAAYFFGDTIRDWYFHTLGGGWL